MRVSINYLDRGFKTVQDLGGFPFTATLNGKPVENCITADDVAGFVERYATDENGELIFDGSGLETVREYGIVKIRF